MTNYVVLFRQATAMNASTMNASTPQTGWQRLAKTYEGSSSTAAVRIAAADTQKPGDYIAIPERSFEVVKIEIETNPRVKVVKP